MRDLSEHFPLLKKYTYLNTPAIGLLSDDVRNYKIEQTDGIYYEASAFQEKHPTALAEVREEIAAFYHAKPERVTLVSCFSVGLNALLEGVDPHSKILLLKDDYPSINWSVEARDFELYYATIDENLEEHIYQQFQKHHPGIFIFSIVQYINGIKVDMDFIRKLKIEFPSTLIIGDGTQYLGTEAFDFNQSGLDVLGASAYKWLNAGLGNGFFLFKDHCEERIHPKHLGFGSIIGKYKSSGDTLIGKFEGNHLDITNIGSIRVAIQFQRKIGIQYVESQTNLLSQQAKQAFTELQLLDNSVVKRKVHSNIFNIKGDASLYLRLISNGILCAQRGQGIRVGFHYYNTEEDLNRLLSFLTIN